MVDVSVKTTLASRRAHRYCSLLMASRTKKAKKSSGPSEKNGFSRRPARHASAKKAPAQRPTDKRTNSYPEISSQGYYLHEEAVVSSKAEKQNGKVRVLTVVDLFAGAGGFTLGFQEAGFVPIFAVEFDKSAAETYEANFGPHCTTADINTVKSFPKADVINGGPPCQGFSNLGADTLESIFGPS